MKKFSLLAALVGLLLSPHMAPAATYRPDAVDDTYFATGTGFTAYATPTDVVCIWGGTGRVVYVSTFWIGPQSSSTSLGAWYYVKRSAPDTGGTATTITPVSYDSNNIAPVATVQAYSAAPTLGTSLGNIRIVLEQSMVLTAGMQAVGLDTFGANTFAQIPTGISLRQAVTLRSASEGLCLNFNGASLPGGFTSTWGVEWTEH
ncbi:MAG TPA: hypothetical protein VGG48_19050 [Rhizomicrobium sp.]|jgi:hypothetical protein